MQEDQKSTIQGVVDIINNTFGDDLSNLTKAEELYKEAAKFKSDLEKQVRVITLIIQQYTFYRPIGVQLIIRRVTVTQRVLSETVVGCFFIIF